MNGVAYPMYLTALMSLKFVTPSALISVALSLTIILQERHRIDVDCRRTDRNQPMFSTPTPATSPSTSTSGVNDEKETMNRFSAFSPDLNNDGSQAPSNDHIERLAGILLTYNFHEKQLGK